MSARPETVSEEVQDGEDSSRDSGSPSSPREDLESPRELKPRQTGERVSSTNCPESPASAVLSSRELWQLFDAIGTEMIVTRRGRRMFPAIKVELYDLKPDVSYILLMDMAPVDKYRYKYNAGWVRCFEEECAPTRLYIHPDSPALGSHWTSVVINFYKLKLTNNQLDKQGHIIVNSMHRYQPRLHIVESDDINSFNWETRQTFIFPGTQFTTVTAYQNDKITQLKIQTNPFAKGFRTPFSRCRSRNPPGACARFTLRSGSCSDSGVEDPPHSSPTSLPHSSPTSLFSPKLLLPTHDSSHIFVQDSGRVLLQGQEMAAPRVLLPGWDLQRVLVSEPEGQQKVLLTGQDASPILLQGQNGKPQILAGQDGQTVVLPGQEAAKLLLANRNYQKLVLPTAQNMAASAHQRQEAQVVRVVVAPDGQKLLLPAQKEVQQSGASVVLDSQEGQKVANGQTFLLRGQDSQQVIVLRSNERVNSTASVGTKRCRPPEESQPARKLPCLSASQTAADAPMVLMYQPVMVAGSQPPSLLPRNLLQPNARGTLTSSAYTARASTREVVVSSQPPPSQPQVSTSRPLTTSSIALTSSPLTLTSSPLTSTLTSPTVVNGLVHLKSSNAKVVTALSASPETKRTTLDIRSLTREGVASSKAPPALLQIQSDPKDSDVASPLLPTSEDRPSDEAGELEAAQPPAQRPDVVLVQATPPSNVQKVLVIGEKGEVPPQQQQMVLPVAYDQQLLSMPIYRVGGAVGAGLQPVQLVASLPTGGSS